MKARDWKIVCFEEVTSTNDKAAEYAQTMCDEKLVIKAKKQTAGRGRRGRSWLSLEGNLFFSILLEYNEQNPGMLVIISALSLWQSIKFITPSADVWLKWPNDVLLNGKKVSGILLEKAGEKHMIIGIGVNIVQSPQNEEMLYPTVSLKESGIDVSADDFLQIYLKQFDGNMNSLQKNGFEPLRQQWIANAKGIGAEITVQQHNKQICGIFRGIDENANLLLQENTKLHKILAGDVFYKEEKK